MANEIADSGYTVKKVSKRSDKKLVYVNGPPLENNRLKRPVMDTGSLRKYLLNLMQDMYREGGKFRDNLRKSAKIKEKKLQEKVRMMESNPKALHIMDEAYTPLFRIPFDRRKKLGSKDVSEMDVERYRKQLQLAIKYQNENINDDSAQKVRVSEGRVSP